MRSARIFKWTLPSVEDAGGFPPPAISAFKREVGLPCFTLTRRVVLSTFHAFDDVHVAV